MEAELFPQAGQKKTGLAHGIKSRHVAWKRRVFWSLKSFNLLNLDLSQLNNIWWSFIIVFFYVN